MIFFAQNFSDFHTKKSHTHKKLGQVACFSLHLLKMPIFDHFQSIIIIFNTKIWLKIQNQNADHPIYTISY